jgi:hypothetical protein
MKLLGFSPGASLAPTPSEEIKSRITSPDLHSQEYVRALINNKDI